MGSHSPVKEVSKLIVRYSYMRFHRMGLQFKIVTKIAYIILVHVII